MIIVTGGAGFIGSNLIRSLNNIGIDDILLVDNLSNGKKIINISDLRIRDYMDKEDFYEYLCADNSFEFVRRMFINN